MKENVLAKRYARALFEMAEERGILDKIHDEVRTFYQSIQSNSDLQKLIDSQEISKREKQSTVESLLQDRVSNVFLNFLFLLLKKNRESLFFRIANQLDALVDDYHQKVQAATITAVPLDSDSLAKLKNFLDKTYNADVNINNRIDPSILGGIIVEVDGEVFDGSLQSQLKRLKGQLKESSNSVV
ncbi:F0F1 ATP synthase subunit delta [candidate division KSB1 bacterium]|nr:F0F1 ATP synthase subunit delta [candidate division KSB1 bacterium]NIR72739.1 F0F1 ATP synthase subunit delta [candidate division KSB1 bacterium]NIS26827.1 F0F1 ATP synthase subunit delta [candidate division KSB1 bacterium]NIT73621.1 F0F1 ATP synthase subunit delta [candidate division KSB1 bacterium]NIU27494.1 F0F1 ATP synthase subunit delta [candidate division KSB1 bacterium]